MQIPKNVKDKLFQFKGVNSVGIGYKFVAGKQTNITSIVCGVSQKLNFNSLPKGEVIPMSIDGLPTDVIQANYKALAERTGFFRPAPGGVSIGHRDITAGTLGCLVKRDGQKFILSNNHVLANSNAGAVGDLIYQPGPHDGGTEAEAIATLYDFVEISFGGELPADCDIATGLATFLNGIAKRFGSKTRMQAVKIQPAGENLVDAAIAKPLRDEDVTSNILEIGEPLGVEEAVLGMAVQKSGRTTGYTTDEILQVDVSANVQYGAGQVAMFTDQVIAGPMSAGGDSGSAVLDENNNIVGLLFAGSEYLTVINRIKNVFELLDLGIA